MTAEEENVDGDHGKGLAPEAVSALKSQGPYPSAIVLRSRFYNLIMSISYSALDLN